MLSFKYKDILLQNRELGGGLKDSPPFTISILSNITTFQINEIIEFALRQEGVNAQVISGTYDTILQDAQLHQNSNAMIVFWELCNIIPNGHYKINMMANEELEQLQGKVEGELELLFKVTEKAPLVLFNSFSIECFSSVVMSPSRILCKSLNNFLKKNAPSNFCLVELENIFELTSVPKSFDVRGYYSSKSLYSADFYKAYSLLVRPHLLALAGKQKKALILDCDNTLWSGILGEDGLHGIEMSGETRNGSIYQEVQSLVKQLVNCGVLVGLCSKNNPEDIDQALKDHPDMVLSSEDISVKRVNWRDKAKNLYEISEELNIGVDSMVFIDDSSFEVSLVKEQIPELLVLQVPDKLYKYPQMIRDAAGLFCLGALSEEDKRRTQLYRTESVRKEKRKEFENIYDYLRSLKMCVQIFTDSKDHLSRIAQLTQKTNQFNLTTKRYTEAEITHFIEASNYRVYSLYAQDKFGDYGLTALSIVRIDNETAYLETFLMSCRIIGRNIEVKLYNFIMNNLHELNVKKVVSRYVPTAKNAQVADFWSQVGFKVLEDDRSGKLYQLEFDEQFISDVDYIKLIEV